MSNYFSKFNMIYKYQFGFREGYSTEHALVEITDKIKESIDNKLLTCGIFIDLTKAFGSINHKILLRKLDTYGMKWNVIKLIESYLQNRKQDVRVNDTNSDMKQIHCGVPQGSVLCPFLFIIYI